MDIEPVIQRWNLGGSGGLQVPERSSLAGLSTSVLTKLLYCGRGYLIDTVERRLGSHVTKDLFGFADLFAISPNRRPVLIQTTTASNRASRRGKILASVEAEICLGFADVALVTWAERKDGRRVVWDAVEEIYSCSRNAS